MNKDRNGQTFENLIDHQAELNGSGNDGDNDFTLNDNISLTADWGVINRYIDQLAKKIVRERKL